MRKPKRNQTETQKLIRLEHKEIGERVHYLNNQYGSQIKLCNSKFATQRDYDVLTSIKHNWQEMTDKLIQIENRLISRKTTELWSN